MGDRLFVYFAVVNERGNRVPLLVELETKQVTQLVHEALRMIGFRALVQGLKPDSNLQFRCSAESAELLTVFAKIITVFTTASRERHSVRSLQACRQGRRACKACNPPFRYNNFTHLANADGVGCRILSQYAQRSLRESLLVDV